MNYFFMKNEKSVKFHGEKIVCNVFPLIYVIECITTLSSIIGVLFFNFYYFLLTIDYFLM